MSDTKFNILTDPWVPLDRGGKPILVSYAALLAGEADAEDLWYLRDDLRFYARMLLSALTQALFPPCSANAINYHFEHSLSRELVGHRINEVEYDFELLGVRPFLQDLRSAPAEHYASRILLDRPLHWLSRYPYRHDALCLSCAVPALYGLQAFAPAGGSGYSPGVRGTPPLTTLIRAGSVRQTIWANTLSRPFAEGLGYPEDPERPWLSLRLKKPGEQIGLVEGLFWQPRSVSLAPYSDGICCACGAEGPRVAVGHYRKKSKVEGGFYPHPHTPYREDGREQRTVHIPTNRPVWTGLADMLSVNCRQVKGRKWTSHAAPVVRQWIDALGHSALTLSVFSYQYHQTKPLGRLSEEFGISRVYPELGEAVRDLTELAETALKELLGALRKAGGRRSKGVLPDATRAEFWRQTEPLFWEAFDALQEGQEEPEGYRKGLRRIAQDLFDVATRAVCLTNSKQASVAQARRGLGSSLKRKLFPKEKAA